MQDLSPTFTPQTLLIFKYKSPNAVFNLSLTVLLFNIL